MKDNFHIQWHITNSCNLRCRHCYQNDFSAKDDPPFSQLKKIFENVSAFLNREDRKLTVNITGGEVFLYQDWENLISYLYDSPLVKEVGIITNGFFITEKNLKHLEKFPRISIKISAEGFEKDSYEFFRGQGNFNKFIKGVEMLKETDFEKTLMFTLLETNFSQVEKGVDFLEQYNFDHIIIERFIPLGTGKDMKNQIISYENWIETARFLLVKCGLENDLSEIIPYRAFMLRLKNAIFDFYGAPCVIGIDGIAVMPDGTVFPCRRLPVKIGNLLEESLEEIWRQSALLELLRQRKFLKGKCNTCQQEECLGCRALAYAMTGDFLSEDPLCFVE
jgi:radical SAM protein with 4Fe4S-binding SPASM domain